MSAGESKTFSAELVGGEHGGEQADVTVTVHSVKVKDLPELDDEFAQSASEYDTLGEFRAGTRGQLETMKRMQQVGQARERALDAVLSKIEIPLPDSMVNSEIQMRRESLDEQLERAGTSMDDYLASSGQSAEQLETDITDSARRSVKAGFVLDQLARQEELNIEQDELNSFVIEQAYRMGVQPDRLAQELADRGPDRLRHHRGAAGQGAHAHHRARDRDRRGRPAGGHRSGDAPGPGRGGGRQRGGREACARPGPEASAPDAGVAGDSATRTVRPGTAVRRGRCRGGRCLRGRCPGGRRPGRRPGRSPVPRRPAPRKPAPGTPGRGTAGGGGPAEAETGGATA